MHRNMRIWLACLSLGLLAACGGGGSGSAPLCTPAPFSPSVAYAPVSGATGTAIASTKPTTNVPASCAEAVNFSLASGTALPAGLSLDAKTGAIAGTPTAAGTSQFSVVMAVPGFASVTSAASTIKVLSTQKWTLMVYIAGDNSLADFAIQDINELKAATVNSQVNVVVQVEKGSAVTDTTSPNPLGASTYRGLITGANTALTDVGNQNMTQSDTLRDFIQWSKTNHPAQQYALVLWSHGGGWKRNKAVRGVLQDETNSGSALMSMADVHKGVTQGMGAGQKLAVLAFDSCLMGQYEVAYEMRSAARYLVASEELVPGTGMPYTQVANVLTKNPDILAIDFAKGMTEAFKASYTTANTNTTMSVLDMSKMDDVHANVLSFATQAHSALPTQVALLKTARNTTVSFGGTGDDAEAIDLWGYADTVSKQSAAGSALKASADALKTSIDAAMLLNTTTGTKMASAKGLAVFFPTKGAYYNATEYRASVLSNAPAGTQKTWADYLSGVYANEPFAVKVAGDFSYFITWETRAGIKADVDLAVNEPRGNWAAPWLGSTSPNAFLSGDSSKTLYDFESYTAASWVEKGNYDVFANLYKCTDSATGADVTGTECRAFVKLCEKFGNSTTYTCTLPYDLSKGPQALGDSFYDEKTDSAKWAAITSGAPHPYSDWRHFSVLTKSFASTPKAVFKQKLPRKKGTGTP